MGGFYRSSFVKIFPKLAHIQLRKRLQQSLDALKNSIRGYAQHARGSSSVVYDKIGAIDGECAIYEGRELRVDCERFGDYFGDARRRKGELDGAGTVSRERR